tara:strand:+ start:23443 stop:23844 length:402 start_codon:yes stop_codon:yes gene_type:complete
MNTLTNKELVNLTPHPIIIVKDNGSIVQITPSGMVVRLRTSPQEKLPGFDYHGVNIDVVTPQDFLDTIDWPSDLSNTTTSVIVSMPVGQLINKLHKRGRKLPYVCYGPDSGPDSVIRDAKGGIRGVKRLVRYN